MSEGIKHNFVDDIVLETLLDLYCKNIFDSSQRKQPLDLNINKNGFRYDASSATFGIDMENVNLNLHRKQFFNRETKMNFVNNGKSNIKSNEKNEAYNIIASNSAF